MAIVVDNSRKIIIDKSLQEIMKVFTNIDYMKVFYFVTLLKKVGVDLVEINSNVIEKINMFPRTIDCIYRLNKADDIEIIENFNFQNIVIDYKRAINLENESINKVKLKKVILEIDYDELDNLFLDEDNKMFNKFNILCLRIKNILKYNLSGWSQLIKYIKTKYKVMVDFCPSNEYCMATAISMEACIDGTDFITTCFNGQKFGFAPLEEVLMSVKILKNSQIIGNTKLLSELSKVYKEMTKTSINCMKPVLGEDIFKYESGIHADGIEKNPKNYEPYDPEEIGQIRQLIIGKHSGKKAVMVKLEKLNVDCSDIDIEALLRLIRNKSIELKRNINDGELIKMAEDMKRCPK